MILFLKVKFYNFFSQIYVLKYYTKIKFALLDILLGLVFLFFNPYRICKNFYKDNSYGETPIKTIVKILKAFELDKLSLEQNNFLELGSGRGKIGFFLSQVLNYQYLGIEQIPVFSKISSFLIRFLHLKNIKFLNTNILNVDYSGFSVVYIYGSNFSNVFINKLIDNLKKLKKDAKIITISYAITHYNSECFELKKIIKASFPWGSTYAYLNVRK